MKCVKTLFAAVTGCLLAVGTDASAVITGVTAGQGLKGGGAGPAVILNVAPGPGVRIVNDKVQVGFAGKDCPDGKYLIGFTPGGGLLCSCLGGICATKGSGPDPSGDSSGADIVSVELAAGNGNLTAKILFAPGTYDKETHIVSFSIDADQNDTTGNPWNGLGLEYSGRTSGSCLFPGAEVWGYTTGWARTGGGTMTAIEDGLILSVPLSALGYDDGKMNVIVAVQTQITCGSSTGIYEYVPNLGAGSISLAP